MDPPHREDGTHKQRRQQVPPESMGTTPVGVRPEAQQTKKPVQKHRVMVPIPDGHIFFFGATPATPTAVAHFVVQQVSFVEGTREDIVGLLDGAADSVARSFGQVGGGGDSICGGENAGRLGCWCEGVGQVEDGSAGGGDFDLHSVGVGGSTRGSFGTETIVA